MGITTGIIGAVGSVGSLFGGDSGSGGGSSAGYAGGSQPNVYLPSGLPGADQTYQQLVAQQAGGAGNLPGNVGGQLGGVLSGIMTNPYGTNYAQPNANATSLTGLNTIAPMQIGNAAALTGLGQMASPYASQILQQGFDPNSALYNRSVQQLQDQMGAVNAQSGVSGTPYGAGLTNQALGNFGIDWNKQQLANMNNAATGYGNLTSAAGNAYNTAGSLGTQGLNTMTAAGQLPYQTSQGIMGDQQNALMNYINSINGSYGLSSSTLGSLGNYLNFGNQAAGTAGGIGINNANLQQQQGANLGQSLQGVGNAFNSYGGTGSSLWGNSGWTNPDTGSLAPGSGSGVLGAFGSLFG